jgi:hypothetical protein
LKEIIFRPISIDAETMVQKPVPSKECIPEWFKKIPQYENNNLEIVKGPKFNTTVKKCMPFLDSFLTGYIQTTWTEIFIDLSDPEKFNYSFPSGPNIVNVRESINYYPKIEGYSAIEFSWQQQWIPQLPKGYSMLYTQPLNRYDLPFINLTGIIDNDMYYMEKSANHPFFVKDNFKGIIPINTPMFQMIPIKRDAWKSIFDKYDEVLQLKFLDIRKFFQDGYKKLYWQKKEYR